MTLTALLVAAVAAVLPHYDCWEEEFYASHMDEIAKSFHDDIGAQPDSYALLDVDYDGTKELWVLDIYSECGILFSCGGETLNEVATMPENFSLLYRNGKVWSTGSPGGASIHTSVVTVVDSEPVDTKNFLTIYNGENPGDVECTCNGKEVNFNDVEILMKIPEGATPPTSWDFRPIQRLMGKIDEEEYSGRFEYDWGEDGELAASGIINIFRNDKGKVWFNAEAVTASGNIASLSPEDWIPCKGNVIDYKYDCGDGEYYEIWIELYTNCAIVTEDFSHGGHGLFGMGAHLSGTYFCQEDYIGDSNGYLYQLDDQYEPAGATLVGGGKYTGNIKIPGSVDFYGTSVPVTGIGEEAFIYNYDITGVSYPKKDFSIGAKAFFGAQFAQKLDKAALPVFAYPNDLIDRFIVPTTEKGWKGASPEAFRWVIFKQYVQNVQSQRFQTTDEGRIARTRFDLCDGIVADLEKVWFRNTMFRGYEDYEIEVLLSENEYVATHEFPSFSRWKSPERKTSMSSDFKAEMESTYGRSAKSSYRIGNLRESSEQLAITEFEIKDNEAMIAITWMRGDTILATFTETSQTEGDENSVWGVDDGGEYGIPSLISIALDENGNADLFLVHDTPEGVHCFVLRQEGDKLVSTDCGAWYRWID